MPWTLPTPDEIASRLAGGFEGAFAPYLEPGDRVDARSPNSPLAILAGVQGLGAFDLYLYQRYLAGEFFADTAEDVARQGSIWGVPRVAASAAVGTVILSGTPGTVVPAGTLLFGPGGQGYTTDAAATLGSGGTAGVTVTATAAGSAGSLAADIQLGAVTPVVGFTVATVAIGGLVGQDAEGTEAWRARILDRIRSGPDYGQAGSYARAARRIGGVAYAQEWPNWSGPNGVGVVVAMGGPRVPTTAELAVVQAAMDAMRPVTAVVAVVPAALRLVDVTLSVSPDTAAVRAAVTAALGLFFLNEGAIGGSLRRSRLSEAISSATGEYAHVLAVPAADVALGAAELAVLGTLAFT